MRKTVTVAEPVYKTVTEYGITGSRVEYIYHRKYLGPTLGWITESIPKVIPTYGYKTVKKQTGTKNVTKTITQNVTTPVEKKVSNVNTTIEGGTGNDFITNSGTKVLFKYNYGDGYDTITGFGSSDTLSISGGTYTRSTVGSDVIFNVGSGSITLKNAKGKTINIKGTPGGKYLSNSTSNKTINGTAYADTLYNYGSRVKVDGGTGNDKITSFSEGSKVTLTGGKGNDTVYSWSAYSRLEGGDDADYIYAGSDAKNSTVLGGAGNDTIINYGSYNSILGGAGNDSIRSYSGSNVTITGGAGNDSLWGGDGKDTFIYANGDGKDVIVGFANNDILQITGTFSASYNKSKKEIAFKVGSTADAITLKDFTASTFNVNGTNYKISGSKLVKK